MLMKYLTIVFLLIASSGFAQIADGDINPSDTLYVVVESGTVEDVTYYRLNYIERTSGYQNNQRTNAQSVAGFLSTLYYEQERWNTAINTIDADIARMQAAKAMYQAILTEIEDTITDLE